MLEGNDSRGSDYIDRLQRTLPFLLGLIDQGTKNINVLTGAYKTLMHIRYDYSKKHSLVQIFNEIYTVGLHAQKADLIVEMVSCYEVLFDLALKKIDSPTERPHPLVSKMY